MKQRTPKIYIRVGKINKKIIMKKSFFKATLTVVCVVAVGTGSWRAYSAYNTNGNETDILAENVEALSNGDVSGAKCPNGCKDIGWGWNKILECDCEYDHFSCCDSWGVLIPEKSCYNAILSILGICVVATLKAFKYTIL